MLIITSSDITEFFLIFFISIAILMAYVFINPKTRKQYQRYQKRQKLLREREQVMLRELDKELGIDDEEERSEPEPVLRPETYSIVLSLGTGNLDRASERVRMFYHIRSYCAGCSCPDGSLYDGLSADEVEEVISVIVSQLECGNPTILCRGLPYDRAKKVIKIFYDRANVFMFHDRDGSTLEELSHSTPKLKYIVGDPPLDTEGK